MSQPKNPTSSAEMFSLENSSEEPKFRAYLRLATAEIQAAINQGHELQKEIEARKTQINEAITQLLKAA